MTRGASATDNPDLVVLDFYEGAYGPTLRVDVQSRKSLKWLHLAFLGLGRHERREFVLEDSPEVRVTGLRRVRLAVNEMREPHGKHLIRSEVAGEVEFVWTLDAESWRFRAELADALLRDGRAGHQYLTTEGLDDAFVELAFLEGPRAGKREPTAPTREGTSMAEALGTDELEWLQRWYEARCDGEWEHERGVAIESCDNPGWWVRIDVDKEPASTAADAVLVTLGEPPSEKNGNVGSKRWMLCQIRGGTFDGAGDPTQLANIIRCFREKVAGPLP